MLCREWLNLILPDGTSFGSLDGGNTTTVSFENTLIHIDRNYKGEISSIRYSCSEYDESTSAEHLSNTEKLERFKVRLDELPVFQREDLLSDGGNPLLYGFCIPYPAVGGRNDDQLKWQWQLLSIKPGGEMLLDNKLVLITWDPLLDRITGISFQRLDF